MKVTEVVNMIKEIFPDFITIQDRWNKDGVIFRHKNYPQYDLIIIAKGYCSGYYRNTLFIPYRLAPRKEEYLHHIYGRDTPATPVVALKKDEDKCTYSLTDYRELLICNLVGPDVKFYVEDFKQQYQRIYNEVLQSTQSKCETADKG